jgi:hypothetical protein
LIIKDISVLKDFLFRLFFKKNIFKQILEYYYDSEKEIKKLIFFKTWKNSK